MKKNHKRYNVVQRYITPLLEPVPNLFREGWGADK